jgi:AcrR family transcriptional regulator
MSVSRNYHSPLREEQVEQTRERLLETLEEMLATSAEEVSVAAVAARAKVSVRTAYRYFPTKEALLDAFNAYSSKRMQTPQGRFAVETLSDLAAGLFQSFAQNERLLRATRHKSAGLELRKRRKLDQVRDIARAVREYIPNLDERKERQIGAVIHNIFGFDAWVAMVDNWGLTPDEAVVAIRWATDAVVAKLEAEKNSSNKAETAETKARKSRKG